MNVPLDIAHDTDSKKSSIFHPSNCIDNNLADSSISEELSPVIQSLAEQFFEAKKRVTSQLETICKEKEKSWLHQTRILRNEITQLTVRLHKEEENKGQLQHRLISQNEKLIRNYRLKILPRIGGKSIMMAWRQYVTSKKRIKRLEHRANKKIRLHVKKKYFLRWTRFNVINLKKRNEMKLETITKEIISRYETELQNIRGNLLEAQEEIAEDHTTRQNLENKMRRTLLQGMTAMNMQTLNIFNEASNIDKSHNSTDGNE